MTFEDLAFHPLSHDTPPIPRTLEVPTSPPTDPEEIKRLFGGALLLARSDCCDVCRALVSVRRLLAAQLPVSDHSIPTLDANGVRGFTH